MQQKHASLLTSAVLLPDLLHLQFLEVWRVVQQQSKGVCVIGDYDNSFALTHK